MITKDNLSSVLDLLEFIKCKENGVYYQEYENGASITVDFANSKIIYNPLDINFKEGEFPSKDKEADGFVIHRNTTLNFYANENFVCLVCMHFLLKKGYEPKHIVFEPAFKVGRNNKPSYGDILVFDKDYKPLVLIENKTYGSEFSKEWNLMQKNGGQLFSYLGPLINECGFCENLILFTADFSSSEIIYKSNIITLKDNEDYIKTLESPKTFKNAQGKYFDVWNETYSKAFSTKGIFEDEIIAYTIGKEKYSINDLKVLSYNEIQEFKFSFETILRYHAITDFEHTFYILVDLFLCKITDELNNPDNLQFTYKGISLDTPMDYCNRLLKLYQDGKKEVFSIDVINKTEDDISDIFENTNRVKNGLYHEIIKLFNEIKFYNIKKFNFINVENREDFELNFNILIEITSLIQDINLSKSDTNHFFGDLFEKLLNKNVHQTEGQFFTPLPIVNFIINSLPCFPKTEKFKVLDYACGAGHFLTEFFKHYDFANLYGIEKNQNLSQVAKIATILNGCQNAKIVFKDALSVIDVNDFRYKGFDNETFDCIIANPPYSVKGFLDILEEKDRNQFSLINFVDEKSYNSNDNIEYFFIELAALLLKINGLCAIIVPSSILDNGDNLSIKVRDFIFENFNILSIVELNSRTFGSTGKNTIILFLQRVKKNVIGLLDSYKNKKEINQYTTSKFIVEYCMKQNYDLEEYNEFIQNNKLGNLLKETVVFQGYKEKFSPLVITNSLQKKWFIESNYYLPKEKINSNGNKSRFREYLNSSDYKKNKDLEGEKQFVEYAQKIEIDKLQTFVRIADNEISLLKSPPEKINGKSNKDNVIKFLGYDWSSRKGNEGISYITETSKDESELDNSIENIQTPLFNPKDENDKSKFAYSLRFHNQVQAKGKFDCKSEQPCLSTDFNELLEVVKISDLIDFEKTDFDKKILIEGIHKNVIYSKYEIKVLGKACNILIGGTPSRKNPAFFNGNNLWVSIGEMIGQEITDTKEKISELGVKNSNVKLIPKGTTLLSFKLSIGKTAIAGKDLYTNEAIAGLCPKNNKEIRNLYLYYLFNSKVINLQNVGNKAFGKTLNSKYLREEVKIPIPPIPIQDIVIEKCEKIKKENEKYRISLEEYTQKLQDVFYTLEIIIKEDNKV